MSKVNRIAATIRQWPYAIEKGTYHLLFERRVDLHETADGPPIYTGEGYVFGPTGDVLTAEQYQDVCDLLNAPVIDGPGVEERAAQRRQKAIYGRVLTPEDRRRNAVRARATEGSKYV
ncbi:hypothetical protein SAMN05421666_1028 [Roseovarius nanhaiticus]|uniref:Uncharacterized protein n=1 Tax=Roseovarius nanhaiticus TaxID=573024 RepID=A0A1N7FGS6_9RHOB|nr:hypothetical protein [Roseovarius nanhaiticus]SEK54866.1 hypothetical protein SAMN05216208_1108 [Roseovarius nanhaiticus]SIR99503.1 hypothetical protein SAMN05421666_1028 [Roseovarius nanhaiticus]